ncbi:hypothetical protein BJ508DRAFT_64293 [Ascobolus immersus RN42]|uniref:NUDE domain-containing protein n=1 Tax=Ascobolus immersus RN42 TaxID=1160509 RepID=A0A3N4J1I8_ASCIM|nr:hypothetical protein BJ508DRAFT_64293 [Ascobolus immersus RN42]
MSAKDSDADASAETLEFYKSQIAELEAELADFQQSSRELETELEKELEASEKQHRDLKNKNEALRYEVEEWKNKYKESKKESNAAQTQLHKEITALRDQNRTITLRLRDIEVQNDDFERQERVVKSSLEDLESKYNQAIERAVMLETEIHQGDEERQNLRIETQRLRQELSDLKVEAEITQEKLANALRQNERYQRLQGYHHASSDAGDSTSPSTPITASSPVSKASSHSSIHHSPAPPSPPISEASTTPSLSKYDPSATPRPLNYKQITNRHTRGTSIGANSLPAPSSRSLNQIRGLIGQMQKLEQRVQNARSKLPAPNIQTTPTKASPPRNSNGYVPQTVTIRSHRKDRPGSTVSNSSADTTTSSQFGSSRLSYGITERPSSRMAGYDLDRPLSRVGTARPESRVSSTRPESRASQSSRTSLGQSSIPTPGARPESRTSMGSGRVTPLTLPSARLPRPSLSASSGRTSISKGQYGVDDDFFAPLRTLTAPLTAPLQPPISRRNTFTKSATSAKDGKSEGSRIARPPSTPVGSGLPRRSLGTPRKSGDIMGPPSRLARKKIGDIH